jgi:hypothetical protein
VSPNGGGGGGGGGVGVGVPGDGAERGEAKLEAADDGALLGVGCI